MAIESEANVGLRPVTTLTGTIVDQAALAGILDSLFNLGLTLISVKLIEEEGR